MKDKMQRTTRSNHQKVEAKVLDTNTTSSYSSVARTTRYNHQEVEAKVLDTNTTSSYSSPNERPTSKG